MYTIDNKTEFEKLCSENRFVLVDFSAEWCGPCKRLKPLLEQLNESFRDVKFVKVDVDENQELAMSHNVTAMPSIMFYVDGKLQTEFVRGVDINSVERYCNKFFTPFNN